MINPIKGTFKTFQDYVKVTGHNDKELDPKQFTRIETDEKILYLTFDTCPDNEVNFDIINWLTKTGVEATIFLNIEWYKRNISKGLEFLNSDQFTIGGHGYNHERPIRQSFTEQTHDIDACVNYITNVLRREVKWYRSPYGKPNEDTFNILGPLGIRYASWAGHVFDKTAPDLPNPNDSSRQYMKSYTKPGDIWLFHINGEGIESAKVVKEAYEWAIKNGYQFKKL